MRLTGMIILCLLSLPFPASARAIAPLDGLEALRRAFSNINDFTAEFTQEKRLTLMKRSMQMSGTVRFRKPDLFFMEITKPYANRMILRDGTIEQIMGTGERNRIQLPPEQGLRSWIIRFSTPLTALPENMGIQADLTGGVYTVTITPQGNGQVQEAVISFRDDGTFRKLTIAERNGDRSTMAFHKVNLNVGLTEKDFRF